MVSSQSSKTFGLSSIKTVIASLLILIAVGPAIAVQEGGQRTQATGYGSVIAGDVAKARDDALADALRKTIENVMGLMVEAETVTENYQLVEDNIFSNTSGYVSSYNLLEEGLTPDSLYYLSIEAFIRSNDLENDLDAIGLLIRRIGKPRLMVLLSEDMPGVTSRSGLGVAENALMSEFKKKGFEFVDTEAVRRSVSQEKLQTALEGEGDAVLSLGREYNVELLIVGEAVAMAAENTRIDLGGMKSYQADISLRAVKADNGVVIAEATAHAAYPHINPTSGSVRAVGKAAVKVTDELVQKILERWRTEVAAGRTVLLKIKRITSFSQLNKFKNSLKYYVRGVQDVHSRSFSGTEAELDVEIKSTAEKMALELDGKRIEDFTVTVIGVSANTVTISLGE